MSSNKSRVGYRFTIDIDPTEDGQWVVSGWYRTPGMWHSKSFMAHEFPTEVAAIEAVRNAIKEGSKIGEAERALEL